MHNSLICPTIPTAAVAVSTDAPSAAASSGQLGCLVPTYMPTLPNDPAWSSGVDTLYDVTSDANGRITVCAPLAVETALPGSEAICVTR